ncbi:hypothetical protein EBS67_01815 [bacterium]|nr:right-handed parallel beta-helix repeat-containing protein [Gemmataceae bacterium]NBS88736.1 hypothetical protein [bacterium]
MGSVLDFGAKGDGISDDTIAIQHAVEKSGGDILFPKGSYLITKPIRVMLGNTGPHGFRSEGGTARVLMKGAGPAFQIIGTHQKSALPEHISNSLWLKERMPLFQDLEITGDHPEADGISCEGSMQPTFKSLLIRKCRNAIHLRIRDRNVIISDCHIFDNSGIGIFMDKINLHQINITGNHISYCKRGGIVVRESEIRNIQIVGNDIEYNFDPLESDSNDILFDCRKGTVREGTIVGNTIQAKGSAGGANIRLLGVGKDNPNAVGLLAISGNLIGSQETAIHINAGRSVVISGNSIYSGYHHSLLLEDSEHLVIGSNSIDHNPEYKGNSTDAIVVSGCKNIQFTGNIVQHTRPAEIPVEATMAILNSTNVQISSCQFHQMRKRGILLNSSSMVRVNGCIFTSEKEQADFITSVDVDEKSKKVMLSDNFFAKGKKGNFNLPTHAGQATNNISSAD